MFAQFAQKAARMPPTKANRRYLRKELSDGWKAKTLAAIEEIKLEHESEPQTED